MCYFVIITFFGFFVLTIVSEFAIIFLRLQLQFFTFKTTVTKKTVKNIGMANGKITLYAKIKVYTNGSFGQIKDCSEYTTFTGFTYGFGWNEDYMTHRIASNGQSVKITCEGTLDYYLLVNSVLRVYSQPIEMTINYSL